MEVTKPAFIPRPPESPEVIAARWQKKKERIRELSGGIRRLRVNVTRDISQDEDEKLFLTALVIAVMDISAERIGNDTSQANGHVGVTGFSKSNITINGDSVRLDYVGKSGVRHEKSFTDERIAKGLKRAIKNSPSNFVFETEKGLRIKSAQVNRYLSDFSVSSKNLRGYAANKWTIEKLKSIEPEDTDKKRKKQLNKILKSVSEKVGHGRPTLKKHYLIPELWDTWVNEGKIIDISDLGYMEKGGEAGAATVPSNRKIKADFKKVLCDYQIFEVTASDSNQVARIFVRPEEHYDCSEFKNKIFTLAEFEAWYSKEYDGEFTYYDDWYGFNVPDYVFEIFLDGKFNPLSAEENWLLDNIKSKVDNSKPYYIVGYAKNDKSSRSHELAHALYYLSPEYKLAVDAVVSEIPSDEIFTLHNFLTERNYDKSVFPDEMQAYLMADKKFLSDENGWRDSYEPSRKKLIEIFDSHFKSDAKLNKGGNIIIGQHKSFFASYAEDGWLIF